MKEYKIFCTKHGLNPKKGSSLKIYKNATKNIKANRQSFRLVQQKL